MALTQTQVEFLSEISSTDTILAAVAAGNLSQEDADRVFALDVATSPTEFEQMPDVISGFVSSKEAIIIQELEDMIATQLGFLGGLEDIIKGALLGVLDPIIDLIQAIPNQISAGIEGVTTSVFALVNSLEDRILDPVLGSLSSSIELISRLDNAILDGVNSAVAPIIAVSNSIFDQVEGFATALRDTIPDLGNVLGSALGTVGDSISEAVKTAFDNLIEQSGLGGIKAVLDAVGRIPELIDPQEAFSPDLQEKMGRGTLGEFAVNPAAMVMMVIPFINTLAQIVFTGRVERIQQASRGDDNSGILPISDLTTLHQRGLIDINVVDDTGFRLGLNPAQIANVFDITRMKPGTLDIIEYWRREMITDDEADRRFHDLGWDRDNIELLKIAAFPPPGTADLIRMSVREVFSPEIAARFGQFEEIPEPYLFWAKRIGLSEEWARNFWAAHWVLPSAQQGFEMLHRGVIDGDDLERLFVALDIMPFWRAPLKEIAFRPFTRVDVRRMFALGVLDEAGVNRAFLDLGFDQTKADAMTLFTVKWVESTTKVEREKERDLTKGDIIGLFNDGLLNDTEAKSFLERMGFDSDESDLLISREIMQELRQDRKADIRLIIDQAKIKVLNFSEAQDQLNALDLTQKELQRAMIEVERVTKGRVRLPTKADLDSWKQLDLLSLPQYELELDNLGFPAKYVALYVEAIQLEEADDLLAAEVREAQRAEPRPITKGQLDSLLRSEIIGSEEYELGLETIGFSPEDIANFLEQITIQIEERRIEDEARRERGEEAAEKEKPISRVTLGKLLIKRIITLDAYELGLQRLGFSQESIDLLVRLILDKITSLAEESEE